MDFKFTGKYKSLENINWNNIPKLSVITGKNGTGKSQLLSLIDLSIKQQINPYGEISGELYRIEDIVFLTGEWALNDLPAIGLVEIQEENSLSLYKWFCKHKIDFDMMKGDSPLGETIKQRAFRPTYRNIDKIFDSIILKNKNSFLSQDEFEKEISEVDIANK